MMMENNDGAVELTSELDYRIQKEAHEIIGFDVTYTRQIGAFAPDQISQEIWLELIEGIDQRVRLVTKTLLQNRGIICDNANLAIAGADKYYEPFFWAGSDPEPREVGPDWFSSDPQDETRVGLIVTSRHSRKIKPIW